MPILLAGTIEIVHIEQVSALFTFRLGQALLYYIIAYFLPNLYENL
jgi:putative copper export protein